MNSINRQFSKNRGFTFIELMTSVSIIMILTSIGVVSYSTYTKRIRDDQRVADMERIRGALEQFRSMSPQHKYPVVAAGGNVNTVLASSLAPFIDSIPTDPLTSQGYYYYYWSSADGSRYGVHTRMESQTNSVACTGTCRCKTGVTCNFGIHNPI